MKKAVESFTFSNVGSYVNFTFHHANKQKTKSSINTLFHICAGLVCGYV